LKVEVCEVYRLHRETFYLAVDFIDRYLGSTEGMHKNRVQLLGEFGKENSKISSFSLI
jgi:cyclin E